MPSLRFENLSTESLNELRREYVKAIQELSESVEDIDETLIYHQSLAYKIRQSLKVTHA